MSIRVLGMAALLAGAIALAGCGSGDMGSGEVKTLETNLNKPVDVEKIRAEYKAQQEGGRAGAAIGEGGQGNP